MNTTQTELLQAAESVQEPMAIVAVDAFGQIQMGWRKKPQHNDKLYTTPPAARAAQRKPLTIEWITACIVEAGQITEPMSDYDAIEWLVRKVEAAHGITEKGQP